MRKILIGTIALLLASAVHAQTQMGTGAYGGACLGPYCGSGEPNNAGIGAAGSPCFGPYCGSSNQSPEPIQQTPTIEPQPSGQLDNNSMGDPLASPVDSPFGR